MPAVGSSLEIYGGPLSQSRSIQVACCAIRESLLYVRKAVQTCLPIVERWKVTPIDFFIFWEIWSPAAELHFSPNSRQISFKKNVFTHSTSYPCSCILSAMKSSGRKGFQSAQSKIPRTDDPHSQVRGVREIDESSPAAEETLQPKSMRNRTGEQRLAYYSCLPRYVYYLTSTGETKDSLRRLETVHRTDIFDGCYSASSSARDLKSESVSNEPKLNCRSRW